MDRRADGGESSPYLVVLCSQQKVSRSSWDDICAALDEAKRSAVAEHGPKSMRRLELPRNEMEDVEGIDEYTKLEALSIASNRIRQLSVQTIKFLDVSNNKLTSLHGLETLSNLYELNIAHNLIVSLWALRFNTELGILLVSGNKVSNIDGLQGSHNLEVLDLAYNQLSSMEDIRMLGINKSLRHLLIQGNEICGKNMRLKCRHLLPNLISFNGRPFAALKEGKILVRKITGCKFWEKETSTSDSTEDKAILVVGKSTLPFDGFSAWSGIVNARDPAEPSPRQADMSASVYRGYTESFISRAKDNLPSVICDRNSLLTRRTIAIEKRIEGAKAAGVSQEEMEQFLQKAKFLLSPGEVASKRPKSSKTPSVHNFCSVARRLSLEGDSPARSLSATPQGGVKGHRLSKSFGRRSLG